MIPDDELTEIEARANAATAGPWETHDPHDACCGGCCTVDGCHESHPCGEVRVEGPAWNYDTADCRLESEADAAFIAAARTDVPKLVAEVRGQRETISLLTAALATASLERVDAECERDDLRATVLAACQRHPFNTSCDCTYCIGVRDGMARAQDEAAAALTELQRTVATAVECLRADGSAGNVERVCEALDVVKGEGNG